jgi:ribosomal protein S18 acetylase RimI-like enzyme
MRDPSYDILVATAGREIAGLVDLWTFPDFGEGANTSMIQNLVVASNFRRRGIADALVKRGVKLAKRRGAKEIHVSTSMRSKKAIALYRKNGFTKLHAFMEKSPV